MTDARMREAEHRMDLVVVATQTPPVPQRSPKQRSNDSARVPI
jgi:hypothetical protein